MIKPASCFCLSMENRETGNKGRGAIQNKGKLDEGEIDE